MNFYEYITRYKSECMKKLAIQNEKEEELTTRKDKTNQNLQTLYSTRPVSGTIPLGAGLLSMLTTFATLLAGASAWPIFLIVTVLAMSLGYALDKNRQNHDKKTRKVYHKLERIRNDLFEVDQEKRKLQTLLQDVRTCCEYYIYVIKDEDKHMTIPIDMDTVFYSNCKLSTYLDNLYNGTLEDFLMSAPYRKIVADQRSGVREKIRQAKNDNINTFIYELLPTSELVKEEFLSYRRM